MSREQRLVNRYIRKQLSLLGKKEDEVYNPLFEALKKAGIPLNEEAQKTLEDDEVDVYDLDKFNICIAMFSRFKLDTPYSLALRMLCKMKMISLERVVYITIMNVQIINFTNQLYTLLRTN